MEENVVLVLFSLGLILTSGLLYLFFYRFRQHKRTTYRFTRLIVGNVLVLLFLGSLLILAGEIRYRFFYDATDSFGLTKTTQIWFKRHFQYNMTSFRDSIEYPLAPQPGQRRVTIVGDSFTAGHGIADVEDRFVNRIRAQRPAWDVQMFAKCGWDTGHYLGFLDLSAQSRYQLDLVVLVYCLNDLSDIVPKWRSTLQRIYKSSDPGFFAKHSYLFNTIYFRLKAAHDPDVADYYQFVRENYEGSVWEAQQTRLEQLKDHIEQRGGRLVVVTFPFVHALGEDYPYREAHERLGRFWESLHVPHLDLLETLEAYEPGELIVNARDAHPNELAHRLASEKMLEFLDTQFEAHSPETSDQSE